MCPAIDFNKTQVRILNLTVTDVVQGAIIACDSEVDARLKLEKKKLDNLGHINSHCRIEKNRNRMSHLKYELELAA